MAGEMAMRGAGLMMAVREGSEIGEPWAPAYGRQARAPQGQSGGTPLKSNKCYFSYGRGRHY